MGANSEKVLNNIEENVRAGKKSNARQLIQGTDADAFSREQLLRLASLAWRSDLPIAALQLLRPFVRPEPRSPFEATDAEKVEYAVALSRIGAHLEALELLEEVDVTATPRASFARAASYVSVWDYAASIGELKKYVSADSITPYEKLIGRTNLLAAYVYERNHKEAQSLFESLEKDLRAPEFGLLYRKVLEIRARMALQEGDLELALKSISEAAQKLADKEGFDPLFLRKWQAFIAWVREPGREKTRQEIIAVKSQARELRHWETIRQCDQYLALYADDRDLLLHLYFGTPFESFRKWLLKDACANLSIPNHYLWQLGEGKGGKRIHLVEGSVDGRSLMKVGKLNHRLLCGLTKDFYRPPTLATLFERVYPGECFNPTHSRVRLHSANTSLRKWFAEFEIPLRIEKIEGFYHLLTDENVVIEVPAPLPVEAAHSQWSSRLSHTFGNDAFSISQLAQVFDVSMSSARRILKNAQEEGVLQRSGSGPQTRYRLLKHAV